MRNRDCGTDLPENKQTRTFLNMKFCPVCKTSYDEEILRFCTKDGTPLVEGTPNFTALPSENELGEETVIRRKNPPPNLTNAQPIPDFDDDNGRVSSPRIIIPMAGESFAQEPPPRRESVRTMTAESVRRQPLPRESNTAMVVALTILGTIALLALGGGVFWILNNQNNTSQNTNFGTNVNSVDVSLNTNLDTNFNASNSLANFNAALNGNLNGDLNANANANANLKTPTPTPTRTPSPTSEENFNAANGNANTAVVNANVNRSINTNNNLPPPPSVTATPTVRPLTTPTVPRPSPPANQTPANRAVNAGILNSRAVNLPKPVYPSSARLLHAEGQVAVQVAVDETGNVTAAKATSGNPLLRSSAETAARQTKFNPMRVNNQIVPVNGILLYNFVNQ